MSVADMIKTVITNSLSNYQLANCPKLFSRLQTTNTTSQGSHHFQTMIQNVQTNVETPQVLPHHPVQNDQRQNVIPRAQTSGNQNFSIRFF